MGRYKRALFLFRIAKTLFISPFNSIIYLNKNVQMLKHFVQIFKLNNDMFNFHDTSILLLQKIRSHSKNMKDSVETRK